jgi:glycyl-tRNA synthetase beta chain
MSQATTANLLVELFVEELPPKALKALGDSFATSLAQSLRQQGLASDTSAATPFASPRRLAMHLTHVVAKAADKAVSQKLMPVSVGIGADGQPTPALLKKLQALGADASVVPSLKRAMDGKAEALFFDAVVPGATLAAGLQTALDTALGALPIPKVMSYQLADGWASVNFVRPAHGLIALHGSEIVPVSALGLQAGRRTQGHRFEAKATAIDIATADAYADTLREQGAVMASFAERRAEIARQLADAAAQLGGGVKPIEDDALLDEVTALVERPNVLVCQFEPEFLQVPQECLILTMKANQKYFPLLDAQGRLSHRFLVVSNISPADPSAVVQGNERVIRPRLADAKFFFDQDRKRTLEDRVAGLAKVVYHNKLGSQGERVERVRAIARQIGERLGGDILATQADQAAMLAKADLLTDMVGEFPELQGTMGRYYALNDGRSPLVADAIEDQYKPRFAGDSLPRNDVGLVLALADKLETLVGMFGIGNVPTGDKDPFALRRHALGVMRMLVEQPAAQGLRLDELLAMAAQAFGVSAPGASAAQGPLAEFMMERFAGYLAGRGYQAREIDAVLSLAPQQLASVPQRMHAVRAFAALPESAALAAANKRIANILKKSELPVAVAVNADLLREPAELGLSQALQAVAPTAEAAFAKGDYTGSLQALAVLKAPVDTFFESVMVNAADPALRTNRMALLASLHQAMNRVADLSRLAT